jgi:hydrogenase nickel incorporation protein HypA/HybF
MHELAITKQIADIAIRHGEKNAASQVTDLYLVIGDLSSVVDDSIQFYWDIIAEGTICEGARLHFDRITAKLRCRDCGYTYALQGGELTFCPRCESGEVQVIEGKEFQLQSINIEK